MEFTWIWVFWQKHQARAGLAIIGILLFAIGWQGGYLTSPYYASTPIVFEEITGEDIPPSDVTSLEGLQQQGVAARKPAASEGSVAGATQGSYVASKNSTLFHHVGCPSAKRIAPANQRWFDSPEEAQKAGFSPSKCTQEYLAKNR